MAYNFCLVELIKIWSIRDGTQQATHNLLNLIVVIMAYNFCLVDYNLLSQIFFPDIFEWHNKIWYIQLKIG